MPVRQKLFQVVQDDLQKAIDVDDGRGRSVPVNMNFIEEGYLSKDTGVALFGAVEASLCHSLFHYKKKNGISFFIRGKGTKLQCYNYKRLTTADAGTDTFTSTAHGLSNTTTVYFTTGTNGVLPTGLTAGTVYYIISSAANTFQVSLTSGGAAIDITTAGTAPFYVYKVTPAWEDLSPTYTTGYEFGFYVYNDTLHGGNSVDSLFTWDGMTFTNYGSAPKGNVLEVFEDRLFVSGVPAEPLTTYYSDVGVPTTFSGSSLVKPLGTDSIVALKNYYGSLLIFKKESIWKLTFVYDQVAAAFIPKLELQSGTYGACGRKSVTWVENDLWFFTGKEVRAIGFKDQQTGVLGINSSVISDTIKESLATIPQSLYSNINVFYYNRRFYLSVPIGASYNNTIYVCHLLYKNSWTKYNSRIKANVNDMIQVDGVIYSTKSVADYGVLRWSDSLYSDNDAVIASEVFFKKMESEAFNGFNVYRYIDLMFKDLEGNITATLKNDANDIRYTINKTFAVGNAEENDENTLGEVDWGRSLVADSFGDEIEASPFIKKRISILQKAQAFILGLSNTSDTDTFTIAQYIIVGFKEPQKMFKGSSIISMN